MSTTGIIRRLVPVWAVVGAAACVGASPAHAQEEGARGDALRVFLDCNSRNCDSRYFRTEIDFVNWVRDRTDAHVHVIMTSEGTGGGGVEYRFDFIGVGDLAGLDDRLTHSSNRTDTEAEVLEDLTQTLRLGLVRYAVAAGLGDRLEVGLREARERVERPGAGAVPEEDPWDFWVFRTSVNGSLSGEERQNSRHLRLAGSANRTTEAWKVNTNLRGSWTRREFELNDSTTFVNKTSNWGTDLLVAKSVAPHWSLGGTMAASSSTRFNKDLSVEFGPGLEWSLFPYPEATRRELIVFYTIGVEHVWWEEETIFEKTEEWIFEEALLAGLEFRQPWGEADFFVRGSHFLDDFSKWQLSVGGGLEWRIVRGLNLDVNANYSEIHNQIYLPREGATDEEILVQRRQLATGYEYRVSLGLSYSFGSIYNNIVNNRFQAARFF